MVNSCAAAGCTSRVMKNDNRAFHKFPINNSEFCKKWIVAMKRETFIPTEHSRICSDHFLPSDAMETKTLVLSDKKTGQFIGFTEYGKDIVATETDTPATEALVLMLVLSHNICNTNDIWAQPKKRKSKVWVHLLENINDSRTLNCKHCDTEFKSHLSTKSLTYHMQHKHNLLEPASESSLVAQSNS
nr:THAP domain-containing protein 1-like [Hydra vulgaris]